MKLYSSLTRDKRDFEPAGDVVTMYVCGLTTSGSPHLGHALSAVAFDVLHRYMEYRGYRVNMVQNFTDVDDKIIDRAAREGRTSSDVADQYMAEFLRDMGDLNIRPPDIQPRATQEIKPIQRVIAGLIEKGYAYPSQVADGDVYFRVSADPEYGKLSRRSRDEMLEGVRVDLEPGKEDPADFALWKASAPDEPGWGSPWGRGRPGWHIECSAMAMRYLGETIDIHGGGLDLIFPHHENEVAQSEAYTGKKPFARFWVHNGLLQIDEGGKMSKSAGRVVTVREALDRYGADAIRLYLASAHYRSPLAYDEERIGTQQRSARRLRDAARARSEANSGERVDPAPFTEQFVAAMDDDLNTPQGLAAIWDLAHEINRGRDAGHDVKDAQEALQELAGVMGLTLEEREARDGPSAEYIARRIEERAELREERRFKEADAIRDELAEQGVELQDSPHGTTWSRV